MNKNELISVVKKINDISKYSIKGGTSMFNREYPKLLEHINNETKKMQIYSQNNKLAAKLLFLIKYNGDINKITVDGKLMIFDNKLTEFKIANLNAARIQWDNSKLELSNITNLYSKEETIQLLKNNYSQYFGKSGNRKLIRDNKKLYLSLYYHTSHLNNLNRNLNKFSMRLYILMNNIETHCLAHSVNKFWRFTNGKFIISCKKCEPKYPSINWFQKTYGDEWEVFYNKRNLAVSNNKTNSLQWFIKKYGDECGIIKYGNYVENKMNILSILKGNRYSKISQDLFWKIYDRLNNKENIYFHDLNQEFVFRIPKKYSYQNTVMMFDFKQNNKIIEYNGNYWHNKNFDDIRYSILNDSGYEIMTVTSDEYNRNNKNDLIIEKCIKFLSCK